MMGFYGDGYTMGGFGGGWELLALMTWSVWLVVGILLMIFLWEKINKKE